jgi:hypothetical protein
MAFSQSVSQSQSFHLDEIGRSYDNRGGIEVEICNNTLKDGYARDSRCASFVDGEGAEGATVAVGSRGVETLRPKERIRTGL